MVFILATLCMTICGSLTLFLILKAGSKNIFSLEANWEPSKLWTSIFPDSSLLCNPGCWIATNLIGPLELGCWITLPLVFMQVMGLLRSELQIQVVQQILSLRNWIWPPSSTKLKLHFVGSVV